MKIFILITLAVATTLAENSTEFFETVYPKDDKSDPRIQSRITNGYPAYNGKAPYTVSLFFRRGNSAWTCGGSIIGHTWVLTAAHCTNNADEVTIRYGSNEWSKPAYTHTVKSSNFIQHHNWPGINGNDIALIRTPHVDYWQMVNRVVLPSFGDRGNSYAHWWAVTCGWGRNSDHNNDKPDWLQCVDLQIMSNQDCGRYYNINGGIICVASPGGKGVCNGDSGGPLVTHDGSILVGVTSFRSGAGCQAGHPGGFTRVTSHLDWIRQHSGIAY